VPFTHLFTPLTVGPVTLRNRVMTSALSHDLWRFDPEGYHRWNMLGARAMHFYAERARGGFALLTAGQAMVHPSCGTNRPAAYLPQCVDEYRPITDAVHAHGAKIFMQLNHNGRGRISGTDDWDPVLTVRPGPSFYPGAGGELTKEIDLDEIRDVQRGFATSARYMEEAGFDGVEVQAAHSYLISEFLTPALNHRTDEYGGSLANRMRFLREVLNGVRDAVSPSFAVGIRLNSEWRIPDGFTLDEATEVAAALDEDGLVDFVNVSGWGYDVSLTGIGSPLAPLAPNAGAIRAALSHAMVFVVGRIINPDDAERIIVDGQADMVALGRQSIADPEWPSKVQEGRRDEVLTCIGASQGCIARHYQHLPITCTQNPTVGREAEWGAAHSEASSNARRVLVVGGGPAGLEAAVVAARRGHDVVLCEATDQLGGQVNLIMKSTRRKDFGLVVDWRRTMLGKLGVDVRLGTFVDLRLVEDVSPDVVVIATGSAPITPAGPPSDWWGPSAPETVTIPGADQPNVFSGPDVLSGSADGCRHVVVFDNVGYYQSSDPLEYLVSRGSRATGVTTLGQFAVDMVYNDRPAFLAHIRQGEVAFHPFSRITAIGASSVDCFNDEIGRPFRIQDVDGVVLSLGNIPRNALYYELRGQVPEIHRIGDCVTPRRVEHALFEAHRIARSL
jgi:2,4-dienoyl-CoA reductase-like NADH-dependent reductase (Old Yellow Enzyme family)